MRAPHANTEVERQQLEHLFAQRAELWRLAHRGFELGGRGFVLADAPQAGSHRPIRVCWRPGREILGAGGDRFGWLQHATAHLREYNPHTEFVLQYVSPRGTVHVYRVSVPPSQRHGAQSSDRKESERGAANATPQHHRLPGPDSNQRPIG